MDTIFLKLIGVGTVQCAMVIKPSVVFLRSSSLFNPCINLHFDVTLPTLKSRMLKILNYVQLYLQY
jgi:hypothetical protein